MTEDLIDVRCPGCDHRFETGEPDEVECPCCGWEFASAENGTVEDDGGLDRDPPFEVNAEGELDADGLLAVTCTGCSAVFQVGESGVVPCPRCGRTLDVDSWGQVIDGVLLYPTCPACKTVTQQARATHEGVCRACGCSFEWWDEEDEWYDYWAELEFEQTGCPNCGQPDEPGAVFARSDDGRVRCLDCDWVFDPSRLRQRSGDDEDPDQDQDPDEDSAAPGLRPRDRRPNAGTHTVAADVSGAFTRIQDAINRAWHGDRILVRPGHYPERLVLTKPVEIAADGPPGGVVVTSPDGPCLLFDAERAEVRGVTFVGGAGSGAAVEVGAGRLLLEDCSITSAEPACLLVREPRAVPVLRRCHIHGGGRAGVLVTERSLATLEECVISGHAAAGIEVLAAGRLQLQRCQVIDNGAEGVSVRQNGRALVQDSALAGSGAANLAVERGHARLERCEVRDGRSAGVRIREGIAVLDDCLIRGNALAGVSVRPSGRAVLRRCRVCDSRTHGVRVAAGGQVLVEECELADNARTGLAVCDGGQVRLCRCRCTGNASAEVALAAAATVQLAGWDANGPERSRWDITPGGLIRLIAPGG
jgi:F-box protein 11